MKRNSIIITLLIIINSLLAPALVLTSQAGAAQIFSGCGSGSVNGKPAVCSDAESSQSSSNNPIISIIKAAIEIISYVVGAAAIIGIIISAIRFITANGDSNAVASARTGLVYSLVGVAVVVIAQSLVVFVLNK